MFADSTPGGFETHLATKSRGHANGSAAVGPQGHWAKACCHYRRGARGGATGEMVSVIGIATGAVAFAIGATLGYIAARFSE